MDTDPPAKRIEDLEREVRRLRSGTFAPSKERIVDVPPEVAPLFDKAAEQMRQFFSRLDIDPARSLVAIDDERYILVRASAFSIDFLDTVTQLYADRGEREALAIARGFLFDIAHTIGIHDAKTMHEKLGAEGPLEKLAGGPVHFAYSGWSSVAIKGGSNPVPDDTFCLVYEHPYSFEADSFLRAGRRSEGPVCIMNAGYSSGWCEASFGLELTAIEVTCRARGDAGCHFVMAPPDKLAARVKEHFAVDLDVLRSRGFDVPMYFERKRAEEEVRHSLDRLKDAQEELVRKERLATVGLLVAGVAHEVNTPLGVAVTANGVIQEELTKLKERFEAGALSKNDIRAFFERSEKAAALVDTNLERAALQIAKFKRVAVDNATQDRRRVDLAVYVKETIDSLGPLMKKERVAATIETYGELSCTTHPGAVAQILINFVTNTAVHGRNEESYVSPELRRMLRVKVELSRLADGRVQLRYSDDGCGMPPKTREQAFQPFFTTRRGGGGSGLGLHIVQSLVADVLRGKLELETAPGRGARFELTWSVD